MNIIRASDARQNFQDMIDTVYYKEQPTIIIKRKKPWVIIQHFNTLDTMTQEKILQEIKKNL
jgi:PHD/YefM family antitoxin component YafN of YafNO toxin-antitoxin module